MANARGRHEVLRPVVLKKGVSHAGALSVVKTLLRHRLAVVGLSIIAGLVLLAVAAPLLAPYDPYEQDLYNVLKGPSGQHWLGTDNVGRDLLSHILYGARVSLLVGISATAITCVVGVLVGLAAAYKGGAVDNVLMRVTDAFMAFPFLVLVLALAASLGPGIGNVIIALAALGWTGFARIMRGQVLLVRELPYVEAARALGAPARRIAFQHILPNTLAPIIVAFSITIGLFILTESSAAFLGLGVQPPKASWGR